MLAPILSIISSLLSLYVLVLLLRVVIDLVSAFARNWRPKGLLLILANVVYALTDPPLKALRRVIPPLGIGGVGSIWHFWRCTSLSTSLKTSSEC